MLGIKVLETYFAIKSKEVLVIVDNFNDIDRIEYTATRIEMENVSQ